jgi:site-specific DNA-methyltransferase (adenine-specific)
MEWLCSLLPEGSTIADPFMGSGSTLVAARNLGHKVIGCELSEPFADHTIERLQTEVQTKEGAA